MCLQFTFSNYLQVIMASTTYRAMIILNLIQIILVSPLFQMQSHMSRIVIMHLLTQRIHISLL